MVSEQFNPVILDLGSASVRSGWAGHDQPKFIESSFLGRRADGTLDPVPLRFAKRPPPDFVEIIRVQEFAHDSLEWKLEAECMHSLSNSLLYSARGLQCNAMERPLFATCPSGASASFKREYYEHFMESVQVPAFFLGDSSVLSMYAVGRTSGLCVDVGASSTTVAFVDKGKVSCVKTHTFGGDQVDAFILSRVEGVEGATPEARLAIAREIKHNACKCSHHSLPPPPSTPSGGRLTRGTSRKQAPTPSPTSRGHHSALDHTQPIPFKLPDGSELDIAGVHEYAPETLFTSGLTSAVSEETRGDGFVLLTGGSAHFQGLHTRLVHETANSNIFPFAQWTHRVHSSFIGASILASLSTFSSLWVTPQSYAENGIDRLINSIYPFGSGAIP